VGTIGLFASDPGRLARPRWDVSTLSPPVEDSFGISARGGPRKGIRLAEYH
jgi:hypothetical protein